LTLDSLHKVVPAAANARRLLKNLLDIRVRQPVRMPRIARDVCLKTGETPFPLRDRKSEGNGTLV
jgi:hypothetical protein